MMVMMSMMVLMGVMAVTMMATLLVTETSAACLSDLLALCSPSAAITCNHLVSADVEEIADA